LSSAIATLLGKGLPLEEAIGGARQFVRAALRAAPGFGTGHGPMGHHAVR
jgi:hydroxymethylpyrimidine/phosphomethylpyrimidine kinase